MNQWEYGLTPEEEAICAKVGYERQLPYMGKPEMNRNYSEGDVWEMWQHAVAAGSELAFARMIGFNDFVPHVNKWRLEEDVPGFEIRYSFSRQNMRNLERLRMHELDDDNKKYILLVDGLSIKTRRTAENGWVGAPYRAQGWAYGHEAKKDEFIYQGHGKYKTWYLPVHYLHPMSELGLQ